MMLCELEAVPVCDKAFGVLVLHSMLPILSASLIAEPPFVDLVSRKKGGWTKWQTQRLSLQPYSEENDKEGHLRMVYAAVLDSLPYLCCIDFAAFIGPQTTEDAATATARRTLLNVRRARF